MLKLNIYISCTIICILSVLFGELIWWADPALRIAALLPTLPILFLLTALNIFGRTGTFIIRAAYYLQWTIPCLILLFIATRKRYRDSLLFCKTKAFLSGVAVIGSIILILYIGTYAIFRINGKVRFPTKIETDHGGWGSGRSYIVCYPEIDGSAFFEILYPLASFEGNRFKINK